VEVNTASGIAALNGLFSDPTQFYVNMHTTVNSGGVMRGQLSKNLYVFFNQMTQAEENPPTGVPGTANSMTYVRVDRDSTGNVTGGAVSFNINYNMGSQQTFTGFHIHNGKIGVNGPVVISTGLSGTNTVVTNATGTGSINIEVPISASDPPFDYLRGLVENPENYYVNIHTLPPFQGGIIRAQLAKETYHFKTNMTTANEVPPITTADTAATGWVTAKIIRNAAGVVTGGTVTFDVNFTNSGPITFTGLHIHHPGVAGVNAPVAINTLIGGGAAAVDSTTGAGNITRVVTIDSTSSAATLAALNALITAPDTTYINIHTTIFAGGVARSQMLPVVNTDAQVAGGGDWLTAITIRNPSSTSSVNGIVDFFNPVVDATGAVQLQAMPAAIVDPNISFIIPASGSTTIETHNKGDFAAGLAKIFSSGNVTVDARYLHSAFAPNANTATTVTSRSVSLPVSVGPAATTNTGVAIVADSPATLTFTLRDAAGAAIAGGSRTVNVVAGQKLASFVTEFLPTVTASQYTGTLTIAASAGSISVLALQFDGSISPVTVTALP